MAAVLERIFIAAAAGQAMQEVEEVRALPGKGLEGDRYASGRGYWCPHDVCQVTIIGVEPLERIEREMGVRVLDGQHRRNLVVRGLDPMDLAAKRARIGEAILTYDRIRPPCAYIAKLTEKQMTKALYRHDRSICVTVEQGGLIRRGDPVEILGTNRDLFSASFERFLRAFR
ncbi:MOSC domain-containing protein [Ferruginivarius sediminum]|uniref:MOSC domain-containing protein n=1 Tax=Ferruginivarius sediminum TaxID=2661937 RepID=A0A369TDG4_9PROT|nr:MOSC domain-containing protein [Ferruginivarius sediminum]RDD62425.1 MOSC domain-containing protein [Ferruginivarius sediminum]